MKEFITAFIFFSLGLGKELSVIGNIFISKIGNTPAEKWLTVQNNRLVESEHLSTFEYDLKGRVELFHQKLYLHVNEEGKVVLSPVFTPGFWLTPDINSEFKQKVSYNKKKVFQLCGDGSIGFNSQCEGARDVSLVYDELFH